MNEKKDEIDTEKKIKKEAADPKEKSKEDKPELVVRPSCTMELVDNKETGVEIVYSENCSGDMIRDVAGKIALDGVRFRPAVEKKTVKEEIAELEEKLIGLKKERAAVEPTDAPSTDAPSTDAPSTDAPSTDAPSTEKSSKHVED